jgi:hypothetical protein
MRIPPMLPRVAVVTCLTLVAWHVTGAQESESQGNCTGLHAGITAQLMQVTQGYSEPRVMVTFHLLNDSETAQTTAPESWKIVIDGKELSDSGWIFGNGPGPIGGYGTLATGSTFDFGPALPIAKYFPEAKEYRLSWKGKYFQSPTVTVRIPASKH